MERSPLLLACAVCIAAGSSAFVVVSPPPRFLHDAAANNNERNGIGVRRWSTLIENPSANNIAPDDASKRSFLSIEESAPETILFHEPDALWTSKHQGVGSVSKSIRTPLDLSNMTASEWRRLAGFATPSQNLVASTRSTLRNGNGRSERIAEVAQPRTRWHASTAVQKQTIKIPTQANGRKLEEYTPKWRKASQSTMVPDTKSSKASTPGPSPTTSVSTRQRLDTTQSRGMSALVPDRVRTLRQQPKSPEIEAKLAARYAAITDLREKAFTILCDLEMIRISPNPDSPDYDSSADDELAPENQFL